MTQVTPLADRIAIALRDGADTTELSILIEDAANAAAAARQDMARAEAKALDPMLGSTEAAKARREVEDAQFQIDRLTAAGDRLKAALAARIDADEQKRKQQAAKVILAERDTLAKELAETYPPIAAKLADLFSRIAANNALVETTGARAIEAGAEAKARGALPYMVHSVLSTRLPAWQTRQDGWFWVDGRRGSVS